MNLYDARYKIILIMSITALLFLFAYYQTYRYCGIMPYIDAEVFEPHIRVAENVNSSFAQKLYNEVRILCCLVTSPSNHKTRVLDVKKTWGKRCNKLVIFSTVNDSELQTVALPSNEGRNSLWNKTKETFKYVYEHYLEDADWFLKVDDDSFVILENLRYLLYPYSPNQPIYFGLKLTKYVEKGFMQGGAYALSKESVIRLVEQGIPNKNYCRQDERGGEDVEMGICLEKLNVTCGDSRDDKGRGRFFYNPPEDQMFHLEKSNSIWELLFYNSENITGMNCCSDTAISFHHLLSYQMYVLEYLIYNLQPFGLITNTKPLPEKIPWQNSTKDSFKD